LVTGDGCNSVCIVEGEYFCTGGSPTSADTCMDICADGRNVGTSSAATYCDDGNTVNGDGCSSTCAVEVGWTCGGGSKYRKDSCPEICGDDYDFSYYACDDGNLINGDGCHDDCTIEIGYECVHGNG
jgi:cysteine-rich repeat protein